MLFIVVKKDICIRKVIIGNENMIENVGMFRKIYNLYCINGILIMCY